MSTERSLTELLQAAQHMSTKADLAPASSSRGLPQPMDGVGEELPKVDRSLAQLVQVGESLWPSRTGRDAGKLATDHEAHASILLGARGLDLPQMSSRLVSLDSAPAPAAQPTGVSVLEGSQASSLPAFLRQQRQNAIVSALHAANTQTSNEVERVWWERQRSEWEQTKQNLLAAFTHSGNDLLSVALPAQGSACVAPATGVSGGLSSAELSFAQVLLDYNKQVLSHGITPSLPQAMSAVADTLNDQGLSEVWRIVVAMSSVSGSLSAGEGRSSQHRTRGAVMAAIVHHARTFLQEKYCEHLRTVVYSDMARASLGGVPGLAGLVKGYLGVSLLPAVAAQCEDGDGALGGPVWALIYHCLRAGGLKEAAHAAPSNNCPAVVEVISALTQLSRSEDSRLSPESEKRLRLSYKRASKTMRDPFKRAVYCVLARCDVTQDHADIVTTTDDYLWLKLALVDTSSDCSDESVAPPTPTAGVVSPIKQDILTLPQLQTMLYKQYGESHFNAYEQPLLYTSVLLLTGQFEAAVEFLRRHDSLLPHAVHIAVALHSARLLSVPHSIAAPLLSRESNEPECCLRLNLARLLLLYTRRFEVTHPHQALHYCFLLRDLKTTAGDDVFLNCVSELALHSRDFDLILGKLSQDGTRTPGLVDSFNVDVAEVTGLVARDCERKGLHEDAIKLYDLAKNHEKVMTLLNKLLAQVVHQNSAAGSAGTDRERLLELACSLGLRYRQHGHTATAGSAATLHLLLDLATVFDLYHNNRYQETIEVLRRLQLVALSRDEVESRVAGLAGAATEVREVLPALLLAAITATHHIYTAHHSPDNTKQLQGQARAIVTFAGLMPLRLHADVNARLVQLEALIN